jgi:hypothetical protein
MGAVFGCADIRHRWVGATATCTSATLQTRFNRSWLLTQQHVRQARLTGSGRRRVLLRIRDTRPQCQFASPERLSNVEVHSDRCDLINWRGGILLS